MMGPKSDMMKLLNSMLNLQPGQRLNHYSKLCEYWNHALDANPKCQQDTGLITYIISKAEKTDALSACVLVAEKRINGFSLRESLSHGGITESQYRAWLALIHA